MFRVVATFLLSSILLTGCAADVATDYDASVNFSVFKTYQYLENPEAPVSLDGARIKKAVDSEMMIRGVQYVAEGGDVLVHYDILEGSELIADGPSVGFGIGTGSRNSAYGIGVRTPTRVKEKKFGKLTVELIDARSNDVVWRSVSQRQLTETMEPAERDALVQDQVNKMFKQYPNN
ncbi:DUF4136 domain-containing protein [Vibrio parahaemolyticus]|uniref:DUF4136 domain-containing protein n=1 Tax=Vibrio mediterranei TaxID=689 RepID=UPI00406774BD